ncbi:MAG: dihydrodipicolinate synthase family protein [Deinococcus sp.]|nr:dihydrodipicolinate synthase family protein [Deinococcus sp.]
MKGDATRPALGGIIPILAMPFTQQGTVDEESLARLIEFSIGAGVQGIALFGLASEYYKLSDAERTRTAQLLVNRAAGRVPVIISITDHALEVAVQRAQEAEALGADALMLMPPFFLGPSADAMVRHIQAIAHTVTVPIIIQYAPLQTGRTIDPATFVALHQQHANLAYVKVDYVPPGPLISALHQVSGGRLKTLVGYLGLQLPDALARGAVGCMPSASLSEAFVHLFGLLQSGGDEGHAFHQRLLPLLNFMMQSIEMLIACEKALLARRRVIATAYCRQPAFALDQYHLAELERHVQDLAQWLPEMS